MIGLDAYNNHLFFFGDLAPVQLRSRPAQPFISTGWVVAGPCAQPGPGEHTLGELQEFNGLAIFFFGLDCDESFFSWMLYNRTVLTLALDTTCCVHDISMGSTGSSLHLLEGCA